MLFKDFKLDSGLITDLEYEPEDTIDFLSREQHDAIYQITYQKGYYIKITAELLELMRMLILTPSVETVCNKWLRMTGNEELWNICKKLSLNVDFMDEWLNTDDQITIEQQGLLFRMWKWKWKWNSKSNWDMERLARNGHLECLQFAHMLRKYLDLDESMVVTNITRFAAGNGHLDCLKFLHENGYPIDMRTMQEACNHLECIKYLHEHGCPWDTWTIAHASYNGNLACVKYLHEHGCPWDVWATCNAAYKGNLHCLKYLHEHGCKMDRMTTYYATLNGHLDCLKYACENGCPLDSRVSWNSVSRNGNLECLKYLYDRGCDYDSNTLAIAAIHGKLDCMKFLHEHGCPWTWKVAYQALHSGQFECFKYAMENGCPFKFKIHSSEALKILFKYLFFKVGCRK